MTVSPLSLNKERRENKKGCDGYSIAIGLKIYYPLPYGGMAR